jgi:hypothetical protein
MAHSNDIQLQQTISEIKEFEASEILSHRPYPSLKQKQRPTVAVS